MIITEKNNCTGCTACFEVCSKKAIHMVQDKEGFLYPEIDSSKCVNCYQCRGVCPSYYYSKNSIKRVIALKYKNEEVRKRSTSGGAFFAIAECIIKKGGWIYGAVFDEAMHVIHMGSNKLDDLIKFQGSKYTQSCLKDTFNDVLIKLKKSDYVLFTGTPCQCAGLKNFLNAKNVDTKKLFICDIICHGVPSPMLWDNHMKTLKEKHGDIKKYQCRSKVNGWHNHIELCEWNSGEIEYGTRFIQKQKGVFYSNLALRPSCAYCQYASIERCSDLTIADFWGIEKSHPEFDDNNGVSLVLINTNKAENLIKEIDNCITTKDASLDDCINRQPNLQNPTPVNQKKRVVFWNDFFRFGYIYVCKKYTDYGIKNYFIKQLNRVKGKLIKTIKR